MDSYTRNFEQTYERILSLSERLLQFLNEFRSKGIVKNSDGDDGLESVKLAIDSAIHGLQEQKYEVAVVAPVSAGKSTFLNAIIGADLLASGTGACTIIRTEIKNIAATETPSLVAYFPGEQGQDRVKVIASGKADVIKQEFLTYTRSIRVGLDEKKIKESEIPHRLELRHPIEAISNIPALSGFALIDTPGPNEIPNEITEVKKTAVAIEVLRTCKAVLYVLDYVIGADSANEPLFKAITDNRKEILENDKGRIFFILNKVDQKGESDLSISETIEALKKILIKSGFSDPIIFPMSSLKALLAKLIKNDFATDEHKKDFIKFFSGAYAKTNEDGDLVTPAPHRIAAQAIEDSGIVALQDFLFDKLISLSGWYLLSDSLNIIDKSAKGLEDTFNTQIAGWTMEVDELRQTIENYHQKSETAKSKVEEVRSKIQTRQQELISQFNSGIDDFSEVVKEKIWDQLDSFAKYSSTHRGNNRDIRTSEKHQESDDSSVINNVVDAVTLPLSMIPGAGLFANIFRAGFQITQGLVQSLDSMLGNNDYEITESSTESNTYVIKCSKEEDAKKILEHIENFCDPHIQLWWTDAQDRLIRKGNDIREELISQIRQDIQEISNQLSNDLGEELNIEINFSTIQFPGFSMNSLDSMVDEKQKKVEEPGGFCKPKRTFWVPTFNIDLKEVYEKICVDIRSNTISSKKLLSDVIKETIKKDFENSNAQLLDYINKFDVQLKSLLEKREQFASEAPQYLEVLNHYKIALTPLSSETDDIKSGLNSWKPAD